MAAGWPSPLLPTTYIYEQTRASGGMANKRKELKISGANLWYMVGLITSDGCLSSDGRHIDITAKEKSFLNVIKTATGVENRIGNKYNYHGQQSHHIQIGNKNFYNFLLLTGLRPNKSLSVGALNISRKYFVDFLRGVIDGDGCIRKWTHPDNGCEQWSLRVYSGSGIFIKWLNYMTAGLLNITGRVYKEDDNKWILKYGKMAAKEISRKCYYKHCLGLDRKIRLARECVNSHKGWGASKTVIALT